MEKKLPEKLHEICQGWQDGPIRLMFQDEARFGRINDVRQCWAPQPLRPVCKAMLTHEYTYAYAAVEPATGVMDTLVLPQVNTNCMQLFLDLVGARHPSEHIVMVLDGAGWHSSKKLVAPSHMRLLSLPPYSPELNPVEHLWDELREKCFHNKVFASIGALEDDLAMGLLAMENAPAVVQSISNWPWIIDGLLKWK
jgi:DDE superfamily endonuclease